MYRKVLIPLDGSREAELVIPKIQPELTEDAEVTLLSPSQRRDVGPDNGD
jgi:hypothetical protein